MVFILNFFFFSVWKELKKENKDFFKSYLSKIEDMRVVDVDDEWSK